MKAVKKLNLKTWKCVFCYLLIGCGKLPLNGFTQVTISFYQTFTCSKLLIKQKKVWNLFKFYNIDTRTMSSMSMSSFLSLYCVVLVSLFFPNFENISLLLLEFPFLTLKRWIFARFGPPDAVKLNSSSKLAKRN